jgi:hypothetical protein
VGCETLLFLWNKQMLDCGGGNMVKAESCRSYCIHNMEM